MLVSGTHMHLVTLIFIILEIFMLIWQSARYFYRPQDKHRGWYCILLLLLLFHNIAMGLFPDPIFPIPVPLQNMILSGTGFLTASFFPFYFYREFELVELRWHALFGVPIFLGLPYFTFFVILYAMNGDMARIMRYGAIIPSIYFCFLLWDILKAIRQRYQQNRSDHYYVEEMAVYCAVFPWTGIAFITWFHLGRLAEVLCANIGFLIITLMFFFKSARRASLEFMQQEPVTIGSISPELFHANCLHYGLTKTEILIIQYIYTGLRNKEVADKLFVSEETVKKHIQNVFRKTAVKNRVALIHKLQNHH